MKRDIVVIGASAGGVEALQRLVAGLPRTFPAAVFVVCHTPADSPRLLAKILGSRTSLPVAFAVDGTRPERCRVHVAPPDLHLLLQDEHVRLNHGPKHNRARPAIDPLFRSAARSYGPRVIAVVLTGLLDDGSAGLLEVKRQGGVAIVQDPTDAQFPDMPRNALSATQVDFCVPLSDIPPLLAHLCAEDIPDTMPSIPEMLTVETLADAGKVTKMEKLGKPSSYSCPECAGVLWEIDDKELLRFRCRVGHAFSGKGLAGEHRKLTEETLWAAARSLEESASFARRLSDRYRTNDLQAAADEYRRRADVDEAHAASIIAALTKSTG